jgi:hypothetical protein
MPINTSVNGADMRRPGEGFVEAFLWEAACLMYFDLWEPACLSYFDLKLWSPDAADLSGKTVYKAG